MSDSDARILAALEATRVVRLPKQQLATFGVTNLHYFVVTEPSYQEFQRSAAAESVIREGKVIAKRPEVVTPTYVMNLQGFGEEARRSLEIMARRLGPNAPGLLYGYHNESHSPNIVSGEPDVVSGRIKDDLDQKGEGMAVVLRGPDDLWDVSLLKFVYEYTAASVAGNVHELMGRGLLDPDPAAAGLPRAAAQSIDMLFDQVRRGQVEPAALKQELDRWGVFRQYEDRFLALFRKGR